MQRENVQAQTPLPINVRARVWIAARHFFSRRDAQDRCWLWLHHGDGRVLALWLPAACLERDELLAPLVARLDDAEPGAPVEIGSSLGHAWPLPQAPVVPLPRWTVSWGHPVQQAIRNFAGNLDEDVLAALGRLEIPGPFFGCVENYNRLATLPQPVRSHRLQALAQFPPLVAPLLLDANERADMLGTDEDESGRMTSRSAAATPRVLDAIDRGRDLIGVLAQHHGIDRALVRSPLCRSPWISGHAPREILRLLRAIPAHARPHRHEELETYLPLLRALPVRPCSGRDMERLARAFAQGWTRIWLKLERHFRPLTTALQDTRDFLAAALDQATLPAPVAHIDANALGLAWLARRGIFSLLEASRRWHAQPFIEQTRPTGPALPDEIPTLLGNLQLTEMHLRELATRAALVAEGEVMRHCVAGYWPRCVIDGTRIFHLEIPAGETATAEYIFEFGQPRALANAARHAAFRLAQLRGPGNAQPSAAMARLAARVSDMLNTPSLHEARMQLALKLSDERLYRRQDHATRDVRPLDPRTREELAQVLAYCAGEEDWCTRYDDVLHGLVAGFQYGAGPRLIDQLDGGDALSLTREPANIHDALAVRVDWRGRKLGYVPRPDNARIAGLLDAGHALGARILGIVADRPEWPQVEFAISHPHA